MPRFRVIERTDNGIASFVSDTDWAQHFIARGYPLRNKWKEQSPSSRAAVPHKWFWRLAVEDAIEAGFTRTATDRLSGKSVKLVSQQNAQRSFSKLSGLTWRCECVS